MSFWMVGSAPSNLPKEVFPGFDITKEARQPHSDKWYLTISPDRVRAGDVFAVYSHPTECFDAIGVFDGLAHSFGDGAWAPVTLRRLDSPVRSGELEVLPAWQIREFGRIVGYHKPFSRNTDGSYNKQFGSPVNLDEGRWTTIWERLASHEQEWLMSHAGT